VVIMSNRLQMEMSKAVSAGKAANAFITIRSHVRTLGDLLAMRRTVSHWEYLAKDHIRSIVLPEVYQLDISVTPLRNLKSIFDKTWSPYCHVDNFLGTPMHRMRLQLNIVPGNYEAHPMGRLSTIRSLDHFSG